MGASFILDRLHTFVWAEPQTGSRVICWLPVWGSSSQLPLRLTTLRGSIRFEIFLCADDVQYRHNQTKQQPKNR